VIQSGVGQAVLHPSPVEDPFESTGQTENIIVAPAEITQRLIESVIKEMREVVSSQFPIRIQSNASMQTNAANRRSKTEIWLDLHLLGRVCIPV